MKRNTAETSKTKWFVGSKPELRFTTPRDIERRIGHARRNIGPKANDTPAIGSRRAVDEARPPPIDEVDLARWVGDVEFL